MILGVGIYNSALSISLFLDFRAGNIQFWLKYSLHPDPTRQASSLNKIFTLCMKFLYPTFIHMMDSNSITSISPHSSAYPLSWRPYKCLDPPPDWRRCPSSYWPTSGRFRTAASRTYWRPSQSQPQGSWPWRGWMRSS